MEGSKLLNNVILVQIGFACILFDKRYQYLGVKE